MTTVTPSDGILGVRLFGHPQLQCGDTPLRFGGPAKCWALLAYLLLHHGERVPRKAVAFALWPDERETAARANLRRHLHLLQSSLPHSPTPWILVDASTLQWNDASPYVCDAHDVFDSLPEGELLPEESGEWIENERARFRATVSKRLLDEALAARGDARIDEALHFSQRLLNLDPFREDVVRLLMTVRAERGDKSGALAVYAALERRLSSELDATPSAETTSLAAAIRANDTPVLFQSTLPRYETPWVDSSEKIAQVADAMQRARLVTLTGPGGIGKTRLAVETASTQIADYPDGILFVDLASIADSASVLRTVADALGASADIKAPAALTRYLQTKRLLLVIDNCEHVLVGCARLAESILHGTTSVRLLATSREALGVQGETIWRVPALTPDEGVRLFTSRLAAADRHFALTEETVECASRISARLDGTPLALELAAARAQSMLLTDLERNLDKRFELLQRTHASGASRQDTLAGSLEWSFTLLAPPERAALERLSIFVGDFSFGAGEFMCDAATLRRLVEKSLLQLERRGPGGRYRLLESIRLFAAARLAPDDLFAAHRLHAEYYLRFLESGRAKWTGAEQIEWILDVEREMPNIDAAMLWALVESREFAATLACALWRRYEYASERDQGLKLVRDVLPFAADDATRAELLLAAANFLRGTQSFAEAAEHFRRALELAERTNDVALQAIALNGAAMSYQQDPHESLQLLERSLELAQRCGDRRHEAMVLMNMGHTAKMLGDEQAQAAFNKRAFALIERFGDPALQAGNLYAAAVQCVVSRDYPRGRIYLERALDIWRRMNHRRWIAEALHDLADLTAAMGQLPDARDLFAAALRRSHEIGYEKGIAQCLEGFAGLFCAQGNAQLGALLLGGAERLRLAPGGLIQQHADETTERITRAIREALGPESMDTLVHDGALHTMDELVKIALTA